MRRAASIAGLGVALSLAGCVTETVRPDGTREAGAPPRPTDAEPIAGPVARPALEARSISTRVNVALTPLGSVEFDAQVLPLVSPDGRFVAVQQGQAPTWPTLLAGPDATVPVGTRLAIYDISAGAPERVGPAEDLPPGLLLGRDAGGAGFLVESPRPDGSRWIGRVSWATGELAWLVRDDRVNAHAALGPGGELVYATRSVHEDRFAIAVANERIEGSEGASLEHPRPAGPDLLFALERSERGLFVVALRRRPGASVVIARTRIAASASPVAAYQAASPARVVPGPGERMDRLALFLPRAGRMGVFDPATGTLAPLPDRSIAAAFSGATSVDGYFCTTPAGLVFTTRPDPTDPWEDAAGRAPAPVARVLADPFVARPTADPERPFILLGPDPNRPDRLRLLSLKPIS